MLALAGSAAVSGVAWGLVGDQLSVTTDIVGSTTFRAFDIYHYFDHFYILTVLFPVVAIALYLVVSRWGPLASRNLGPAWPPALAALDTPPSRSAEPEVSRTRLRWLAGLVGRLGLPALVIALEIDIGRSARAQRLDLGGVAASVVAYVAAVTTIAFLLGRVRRWDQRRGDLLSVANAALATAVVPLLLVVSASTAVAVSSANRVVSYPWLPPWLVVVATVGVVALVAAALVRGGWAATRRVERLVLVAAVGPTALFLVTAVFQGAQGGFAGFDDAQAMAGARLVFSHGLWPWRDVFLLHGFLLDGLFGAVGMWAFGATRWASNAGATLLAAPFTVIALYVFIVYFARRNYALVVAGCLTLVLGLFHEWPGTRYMLMPLVLVLFDRVLRRGSWARCWALMAMVVLTSIVTPESTLLVLGILGTLVLAELVHHRRQDPLPEGFRRTVRCAVTGAALTSAWVLFLFITGCLSGFTQYYLSTFRGTELWGTQPIHWPFPGDIGATVKFALPIALYLLTAAKVAWKLQRRSSWRPVEWVLVAAATPVPLFYQLVLHRFDAPHVGEVFETLIPFVLLWGAEAVSAADSALARITGWAKEARLSMTPASLAAVVGVVVFSPLALSGWADIPSRFHVSSPAEPPPDLPLGYTVPGAVDTTQIRDLAAVIDRYAGASAPVFDFVNELGITYFLLDRVPGGHFYHIESAQTAAAQRLQIDDLERSRPPVVIFNDITFGLPDYDGIWSMERNYLVSQYILDHYRPLVDVHGQLVMLRADLVGNAPPLPALAAPPRLTDLYFADVPACDWGKVPNFLEPPAPAEIGAAVPAVIDEPRPTTTFSGWAFERGVERPPAAVLAVRDGAVIARTRTSIRRTDVATDIGDNAATVTGWTISVPGTPNVRFYALNSDGTVSALDQPGAPTPLPSVVLDQQTSRRVIDRPGSGHVEEEATSTMLNLTLPATTSLTDYRWLEFGSHSGFGSARIDITDQADRTDLSHVMSLETLSRVGHAVYLRAGSCIQWHGYQSHNLTLMVQGAPTDLSVRLVP